MEYLKKMLFIILMFTFMNTAYADECTENKLKELQQLADNINVDVEFDYNSAEAGVRNMSYVTVQGLTNDFYVYADDLSVLFLKSQENEVGAITKLVSDGVKTLHVYSNICPNQIIKKISLTLNTYNPYSAYEECKDISGEELKVCDKFYEKNISEKEFYKEIEEYKSKNKINNIIKKNDKIWLLLIPLTLAIIILIIILKRIKDNRLD